MTLYSSSSFYLITAVSMILGQNVKIEKCENIRHLSYSCSSFASIQTLPNNDTLTVTVQTKNIQHLQEIQGGESISELNIINSVSTIKPKVFKNLHALDILVFEQNVMYVITPDTFNDMRAKVLILTNNQIKEINPGAFKNVIISMLRISHNNLEVIRENVFTNLGIVHLDLSHNRIASIESGALANLPDLEVLLLEYNLLKYFNAGDILKNSSNLKILHLQHNSLTTVYSYMLEGVPKLQTLLLGSNQIATIEPTAFQKVPDLYKLDLGHNQIKRLDAHILPHDGLQSIKQLFINSNYITYLESNFLFRLPNLSRVYYGGNPWQCGCYNLVKIWIDDQGIGEYEGNDGTKPVCIVGAKGPWTCDYDMYVGVENELIKRYKEIYADSIEVFN